MPDHTQQILHDLTKASMAILLHVKNEIILHMVFKILQFKKSCNLIGGEHFGLKLLRTRFFPDMQFSQNHISNYGASFKAKIMLFSLK